MANSKVQVVYVKVCEQCGKEYETSKREQKFCSRECTSQSIKGPRKDMCRTPDWVDPWESGAIKPVCYDSDYYYTPDVMYGF